MRANQCSFSPDIFLANRWFTYTGESKEAVDARMRHLGNKGVITEQLYHSKKGKTYTS